MKKTTILLITVLFMVIGYAAYNATINIYGNALLAENLSDFKVYLSNLKVNGTEITGINETKDEFTISDINGDVSVDIVNDSTEYDTESYLECVKEDENVGKVLNYDYTGGEQTFIAPVNGTYKLETWGAQGGSLDSTYYGGYGGYSIGLTELTANNTIYINVGAGGKSCKTSNLDASCIVSRSYNGGGSCKTLTGYYNSDIMYRFCGAGGGATHISFNKGELSQQSSHLVDLLLVAGGGGGANIANYPYNCGLGGSGGGKIANSGYKLCRDGNIGVGGTNTEGYKFGLGRRDDVFGAGGGGGFYGGALGLAGSGGGSGYIGNSLLTDKSMYCYNCEESSEESTKTISTTCVNSNPTANCAKSGNGYARITLMSAPTSITTDKITITAQDSTSQNIKNLINKSLTCKLKINKISRTEKAPKKKYTISFDANGGQVLFNTKELSYQEKYGELPVPKREVYYFTGWYTASVGGVKITAEDIFKINKDQTLYAHWDGVTEITTPTSMSSYRGNNNSLYSFTLTGSINGCRSLWGDSIYTDDSALNSAAVHAGILKNGEENTVYVEILPGKSSYSGITNNNVTSISYGSYPGSYQFLNLYN